MIKSIVRWFKCREIFEVWEVVGCSFHDYVAVDIDRYYLTVLQYYDSQHHLHKDISKYLSLSNFAFRIFRMIIWLFLFPDVLRRKLGWDYSLSQCKCPFAFPGRLEMQPFYNIECIYIGSRNYFDPLKHVSARISCISQMHHACL